MSWSFGGGGSGGGGALNVPSDQIFNSEAERDTYFANNPAKLTEGAQCIIVTNAPAGLYQVYTSGAWEDRSQVVRGPQGEKGDKGDTGEIDTVGLDANTLPVVNGAGDNFENSPLTVDAQGNVSTSGTFTATELKTNIASLNLGEQKKVSGLGEGVEIHDLSLDKHKFIITQELNKDEDTRAFQYKQEEYQLINIQPIFSTTLTDPEFTFTTQLGDQILYGFEVKVNTTQNNCVAQIFRNTEVLSLGNDANPIWEETFNNVQSDTLVLGSPVALNGNTTYMFKITGEFLGEPGGRMYYSIGARLSEKQELLDGSDRVNVDAIQTPNIETGNGLQSVQSGGSVIIEVSGNKDVIELDVSLDATREITNAYVGKFVSITQSGNPVAIPMQITIDQHAAFETGDTIKIGTSESYVNYYFAVYYTIATGAVKVQYPSKNITMVRTNSGWDVEKDGTYTNVAIIPQVGQVDASQDNPLLTPVSSFAFLEHPGVSHFDNADGTRAVSVDLNAVDTESFTVDGNDTVDLIIGGGINYAYDATTRESTISIDPTNISLDGFAQLETDVVFSKLSIANNTDPAYVSVFNVTNGGNSELNLVGTANIRKVDKVTGDATDVININGTTGAVSFKTETIHEAQRDANGSVSSLQVRDGDGQVMLGSVIQQTGSANPDFLAYLGDTEQSGSIQNLESVNSKFEDGRIYGFGGGAILSVSQTIIDSRRRYIIGATAPDAMTLTISDDLEGCRLLLESFGSENASFTTITVSATGQQNLVFDIGRNDKWIVEFNKGNDAISYRVKDGAETTVVGLDDRGLDVSGAAVRPFQYAAGMPYHLIFETPATNDQPSKSMLISRFPASKTFKFTPIAERTYQGVVADTSNEVGSPSLGDYSDIPLYCFEPNFVVSRDQVGFINWPSTVQINVSEGFYVFGTISGWAGGADRNGTSAVYVGRNADNPKGGGGKIGFALVADRVSILNGNGSEDADNATASQFNKESGVAHFYRYAFYVDRDGNMIYLVQDLNDGVTHQGSTTVNLSSLNTDSRLYVAYDREGANTSTIAVGETTLVMNNEGAGEQRWNWRN